MGDLLDGEQFEDSFGGGGEEGKDGERAVFLILLETATETKYPQSVLHYDCIYSIYVTMVG